jgi:predicted RNA binding protein YcfA (HicA-like mRNA interferase family)
MPRKIRQLKTDLRRAGAVQVSQEGSHTKWKHPFVPMVTVICLDMTETMRDLIRKKLYVNF